MGNGEGHRALGWWCIAGEALLDMLRRCAAGEDPDLVYAEEYANCEVTDYGPDAGPGGTDDRPDSPDGN